MPTEVKFLKKVGTPKWNYHIATPALLEKAARDKNMYPYDPDTGNFLSMTSGNQQIPETSIPGISPIPEEKGEMQKKLPPDINETGRVSLEENTPVDTERVATILNAIPALDPAKGWTKATPQREAMPRVDALSAHLGVEVTREERDAAFAEWSKKGKAA